MVRTRALRYRTWLPAVAVVALLVCPATAFAQHGPPAEEDLLSSALVEEPARYDGQQVTYTGEAIGEAMRRGEMAWLHLNDDAYSRRALDEGARLSGYNSGQAVWVPAREAEKVSVFGDSRHRGDLVQVMGTFNAACPEHGGDMDIHASTLEVVAEGATLGDPVQPGKLPWAIGLSALAFGLYLVTRYWNRIFPEEVSPRA